MFDISIKLSATKDGSVLVLVRFLFASLLPLLNELTQILG